MLVSIIVPVYNVKDYLLRCFDSIHAQTFEDYEVIVVDDGSTDGCNQMVDDYCKDKPKFRVYHKENGGLMSAWKYGLEKANGDYIGFVDSDDYIEPTMYQKLMKYAADYDSDIVFCNHYYIDEVTQKRTLHRNPIEDGVYESEQLNKIRRKMLPLLGEDYISPSRVTKVVRASLLHHCLKYTDSRISSGEDVNSMVPCMLHCNSLAYVDEPLYYYVQRKSSISYLFKEYLLDTYSLLIENLKKAVTDCGLDDLLKEETQGLYNVYGLTWAIYIKDSEISLLNKNKQIRKLFDKEEYRNSVAMIRKDNGAVANIYKFMMLTKMSTIFLLGIKIHGILYKMLKEN